LDIAAQALIIGQEKGYTKHSWMVPGTPRSIWISALKRHLIAYEMGIRGDNGDYTEYDANGNECLTMANHAYAIAFNALALATSIYLGRKTEDDRATK
jgi:hypothetical protein